MELINTVHFCLNNAPAKGSLNNANHPLDALMIRILSEWLPSSGYEKSMNYQLEIYGPGDSQSDDYSMEIWIPVKKIVS